MAGRRKPNQRIPIALSCTVCGARNFKTTRTKEHEGPIQLKKFCPACGHHTEHIESK